MRKPEEVRRFMSWHKANLDVTSSSKEAYELTEMTWEEEYGKVFYKSYESFRSAKSYYNKVSKRLIG